MSEPPTSLPRVLRGALVVTLGWLLASVYLTLFLTLQTLTWRHLPAWFLQRGERLFGEVLLGLAGVRLEPDNASTLEDRRARIVVVNHPSSYDLLVAAAFAPPRALAIGKREVIYLPFINWAWWALRFVRVDRADRTKAIKSLKGLSAQLARDSASLVVAPEGTRSHDGTMGPFKKGAFHLALEEKIPIYPVVMQGGFDLWPRHRLLPLPGRIRVRYLPPIDTSSWKRETLGEHIASVRDAMITAYDDLARTRR